MYLSFYGLARPPFEIAPDRELFFDTPVHTDAVWNIIYGITEERGYVTLTGDRGSGKTTVLSAAARSLKATHPSLIWVEFPDPAIPPDAVLAVLVDRLNLPIALTCAGDLGPLRNRLLRLRESGKALVVVFDEAERILPETLAFLGKLNALDHDESHLFLFVFSGQPRFAETLERPENVALAQRIGSAIVLSAIAPRAAQDYLRYRLTEAGSNVAEIMTPSAIRAIMRHAGGNPGRIHVLADLALRKGFDRRHQPITATDVRAALGDLDDGAHARIRQPVTVRVSRVRLFLGIIFGIVIALALFLGAKTWSVPRPSTPVVPIPPLVKEAPRALAPVTVTRPKPAPIIKKPVPHPIKPPRPKPNLPQVKTSSGPPSAPVMTYRVKRGETLLAILRALSLPTTDAELEKIQALNPTIPNLSVIYPGQTVVLPKSKSPS